MLWEQIIEQFEIPFWPLAISRGIPESHYRFVSRDEKYLEALLLDGYICSNYGYAIWFSLVGIVAKPVVMGFLQKNPEISALNLCGRC